MLKFPTDITQKQMQWERSKQSKKKKTYASKTMAKKAYRQILNHNMTHCYHERAWVLTWTLPLSEHKRTTKKEGLWFFFSPFSLTWQSQWCLLIASLYYWFKFWQWWALELWKKSPRRIWKYLKRKEATQAENTPTKCCRRRVTLI